MIRRRVASEWIEHTEFERSAGRRAGVPVRRERKRRHPAAARRIRTIWAWTWTAAAWRSARTWRSSHPALIRV